MSSRLSLSEEDPGRIKVSGLLSVETVAGYQVEGLTLLEKTGDVVIFDLCEAEIVGSAAIALLISWQRRAIKLNKTFVIENAPSHLLDVADVTGVRQIIAFKS